MSLDSDIQAGLALLPEKMRSNDARLQLHAINRQENPRRLEQQIGGPARGDYQFESGGGVKGVMTHASVSALTERVCAARGVPFSGLSIYEAIGTDAILAAALARLLLWTDPGALPKRGEQQKAWDLYQRVWRPGKPHPERWPSNYAAALEATAP